MAVEKRLSEIIGSEIGGRLHTARSRNDQVATDFKLFVKKSHIELIKLLKELIQTMLEHAKVHKKNYYAKFYTFTARSACEFFFLYFSLCFYVNARY